MRNLSLFLINCLIASFPCYAGEYFDNAVKNSRLSFSLGPSWYHTNSTTTVISPYEIDSNIISSIDTSVTYRLGFGYQLLKNMINSKNYLTDLFVELNWYYSDTTIKGNVWQYENVIFNNYTFKAPLVSNRLMLDAKPTLATFSSLSAYPILGIGAAWNTLSYSEQISDPSIPTNSALVLQSQTNRQFAYDLGWGVQYAITSSLGLTAEYIYTNLNQVKPSHANSLISNAALLRAPSFAISNQSLLFGLNWRFKN